MQKLKNIVHKATATRKSRNISLFILAVLLLFGGGLLYYWSIHKKSIIKSELDKTLVRKTQGLYTLSYSDFILDEVAGSLLVSDCTMQYDSAILSSKQYHDQEPSAVFNLFIPKIIVTGVQTPKALIDKEIVGNVIDLFQPTIELIYTGKGKDSSRALPREELYRQLLGKMQSLQFQQVSIRNARVFVRRLESKDTLLSIQNLTLVLNKVLIDSISSTDSNRILFAEALDATIGSVDWQNKNGLYTFQLDTLSINSSSKNLSVQQFQMKPTSTEERFMKLRGVQTDRISITLKNTSLVNLDIKSLFNERILADSIVVESADVKVYKDMSLPRDGKNRVGRFPHQELLKIPMDIDIKKGLVHEGYVEYKQLTARTGQKGKIGFHHLRLVADNITNIQSNIKNNRICRIDARARFLNLTFLTAQFRLDLGAKNGAFAVNANIGPVSANALNNISEPLAATRIEKGKINGVDVKIQGNDYSANASVKMRYEDLKLAVMEKDKEDGSLNKKGLVSAAANFLVKNNNPGKDGRVRVGKGFFTRDTNRSFFNLIWKSMFVSIAETLGIQTKTYADK